MEESSRMFSMQGTDANKKKFWGEIIACILFITNSVFDTTSGAKLSRI
jgi:hypothetical protein